jgi:hypothetical protein
MNLAVMQPCYLPWRGYFALMKLADVFVHLDDVPLPQGRSYQTRVGIKTAQGRRWLSVPVARAQNQLILEAQIIDDGWRAKHLRTLRQELPASAPIVADILERPWTHLADLNVALANRIAAALDIRRQCPRSSECHAPDKGWRKILHLCQAFGATRYLTGHGARNYFDHQAFDQAGIEVLYLDYDLCPYPQPHGEFDPYLTALDALNYATAPAACVGASLVPWRDFLARDRTDAPIHTFDCEPQSP